MKTPLFLHSPCIIPVLRIEPPGMFSAGNPVPQNAEMLQSMFRAAVKESALSGIAFVPGAELLISVRTVMPHLEELAEVCSYGVSSFGGAELLGGYAFLEENRYVFGVEDDSTLFSTLQWDLAPDRLEDTGEATIYHACDHFISARLEGSKVLLKHERSGSQYVLDRRAFKVEIHKASAELQEFARKFTPLFAEHLSIDHAWDAAFENFKNRPHWFS